ncbi:GGDEF domain-containing protein [Aestuariibius insulae]|uniref:GGDEF domain-containing protein n=1 Tax=Aestuariibius insulae TaxID=2058287 RepID=UPI00345ECB33
MIFLLAVRTPFEAVWKGLFFFMQINGVALLVEITLHGPFYMPIWKRSLLTLTASLPFIILAFYVITYLDKLQREMKVIAATDMLTELPNRRSFFKKVEKAFEANRSGVLFIIDADHFKAINDTHGHQIGDDALVAIADRLRSVLRKTDVVGRIGGEEFALFLPGLSAIEASGIGERLTDPIYVTHGDEAHPIQVTLSIGGVQKTPDVSFTDVMHRADLALYRAKEEGRAQLAMWDAGLLRAANQDEFAPAAMERIA